MTNTKKSLFFLAESNSFGTSAGHDKEPVSSNMYRKPKFMASSSSSIQEHSNQGTLSHAEELTTSNDNQMEVSLENNDATMVYQQSP